METQSKETVDFAQVIGPADLAPTTPIKDLAALMEMQIEAMHRTLGIIIRFTYPNDWVRYGKAAAYLTSGGAERIARIITVTWDKPTVSRLQREGYYFYQYEAMFHYKNKLGGIDISLPAFGTCGSKDKFFALKNGVYLPEQEVDEPNIMKKAYSNMIRNGICIMLGLKDMPQESFPPEFWNKIPSVRFEAGRDGGARQENEADKNIALETANMIMDMCSGDKDAAKKYLSTITAFKGRDGNDVPGVDSMNVLNGKRLEVTYGKVKKEWEAWKAELDKSVATNETKE